MKGPFYTLLEARQKLSVSESELRHLIISKQICVVIYTKKREFIALSLGPKKERVGNACFSYRGHLVIAPESVLTLLDGDDIKLGRGSVSLLMEPENISNWQTGYPYEIKPPYDGIAAWSPLLQDEYDIRRLRALPKPVEVTTTQSVIAQMADTFGRILVDESSTEPHQIKAREDLKALTSNVKKRCLDYGENSLIEPKDLRVPAKSLEVYLRSAQSVEAIAEEDISATGKRVSQLHQLLYRAIKANPGVKATMLWDVIKSDWESDTLLYDTENIILKMDEVGLEWRSLNYADQSLARTSFAPTISRVKKNFGIR